MSENNLIKVELNNDLISGSISDTSLTDKELNWGNAKPPTQKELLWIKSFGRYPHFNPEPGKLSQRVSIKVADLKQATRIIIYFHYLHRGRTMAQLPYWVLVDDIAVGVILYSLPRLSVPIFGIPPMNVVELARMWLSPDVQGKIIKDSNGRSHASSIASCVVAQSLKRIQRDWYTKYPKLPDVLAVVSWADNVHHEGVIYKACNFMEKGKSGGSTHGNRARPNGGRDQLNLDYIHTKTAFLYPYSRRLSDSIKQKMNALPHTPASQLHLFEE